LIEGDEGIYIGETSRSLFERAREHVSIAKSFDTKCFIVKHWVNNHFHDDESPTFRFEVLRRQKDVLSRLIHESVVIEQYGNLNSKKEWRGSVKLRLIVDKPKWKRDLEDGKEEIIYKKEMASCYLKSEN